MLVFQMGLLGVFSAPIRGCVLLHTLQRTHTRKIPSSGAWHTSKSGRAGLTPEINMSPCHARPCKAAARPDIFTRRVFATAAGVSAVAGIQTVRGGEYIMTPPPPIEDSIRCTEQPDSSEKCACVSTQKRKNRLTDKQRKEK